MRIREFAPSPERDENDDIPDQLVVLANRWWNAADKQPQIEHVLNSLGWSIHQVESEDDAVQLQHRDGTTYFISADDFDPELFESKTLDPEIYGEELSVSTIKRIVQGVMSQVDPTAELTIRKTPDGYIDVYADNGKLTLVFGITADGGEIGANIDKAYSSYKGKSVVTSIIGQCFKAAEKKWGKPESFSINPYEDRGHGVWQAMAQKLGATYGGGSPGNFDPAAAEPDRVNEIARLPKSELGDWGDKGTLADPKHPVKTTPLPGGSKFGYAVNKTSTGDIEIMIFDGLTLVAEMDLFDTQDYMKTWRVETVVVDPDYRGQGLGKALYGIALSILKLTVEAGDTQTKHGQQMWLMLNSIPGVEVVGYNMQRTNEYQPKPGDNVVDQNKDWTRYTFPVKSGTSSMRSGRRGTGIYTSQASMIAKWTGR